MTDCSSAFLVLAALGVALCVVARYVWRACAVYAQRQSGAATVLVLTLGDIDYNDRMRRNVDHLASVARDSAEVIEHVDVVSICDLAPRFSRANQGDSLRLLRLIPLPQLPSWLPPRLLRALYLLYAPLRAVLQGVQCLFVMLVLARPATHILVRSTPVLPTMLLAWLEARLTGATLVVDWSPLGHEEMVRVLGLSHPLVNDLEGIEYRCWALHTDAHIAATPKLVAFLREVCGVPASVPVCVLHDVLSRVVAPLTPQERNRFVFRLLDATMTEKTGSFATLDQHMIFKDFISQTSQERGHAEGGDFALVAVPTDWMPKDRLDLLLHALKKYDNSCMNEMRKLFVVAAGTKPLDKRSKDKIATCAMRRVVITALSLSRDDVQKLLRAADLGVLVYKSLLRLDQPQVLFDMYACNLPVLALRCGAFASSKRKGNTAVSCHGSRRMCGSTGLKRSCQNRTRSRTLMSSPCSSLSALTGQKTESSRSWQRVCS